MRYEQRFGKIGRNPIDCTSISSWREASGVAAVTFLSTNKTTVNLRGDQKLVVLGFFYSLVRPRPPLSLDCWLRSEYIVTTIYV